MPKKPVRVPAARAGRNVRWTLEVSADGGKEVAKSRKVSRKRPAPVRAKRASDTSKKRALPGATKAFAVAGPASRGPASTPKELNAPAPKLTAAAQSDPARSAERWRPRKAATSHWPQVVAVGAAAAVVLAALAMTRDPGHSPSADLSAAPASQPAVAAAEPPPAVAFATRREPGSPAREAQPEPRAAGVTVARAEERKPVVEKAPPPVETHSVAPLATTAVNATPLAIAPVSAAPVTTSAANESPVTITGCLEASTDGDQFRLTDTDGAEAPKSRGWRSGFLKKRPAPVALVAAPDPAGLRKFVGHRVTATGLLEDREMRVRSFHSAGALCD